MGERNGSPPAYAQNISNPIVMSLYERLPLWAISKQLNSSLSYLSTVSIFYIRLLIVTFISGKILCISAIKLALNN